MVYQVLLTKTAKMNLDYIHPAVYPHVVVSLLALRRGDYHEKWTTDVSGIKLVGPYETLYIRETEQFSIVYTYAHKVIYVMTIFMK